MDHKSNSLIDTVHFKSHKLWNLWPLKSTYYGEKKPLLVDFEGNTNESFQFRFGTNTEVYGSCPVVFQGENFIFGGATNKRQVSAV